MVSIKFVAGTLHVFAFTEKKEGKIMTNESICIQRHFHDGCYKDLPSTHTQPRRSESKSAEHVA